MSTKNITVSVDEETHRLCAQPTISSETRCTSVMRFLDTNILIYAVSAASGAI